MKASQLKVFQTSKSTLKILYCLIAGLIILALLLVAYLLGAWSSCGSDCAFDVNLFSALGTWVGGLATAISIGLLALPIWNQWKTEITVCTAMARQCVLRSSPGSFENRQSKQAGGKSWRALTTVYYSFENRLDEPVTEVEAYLYNADGGRTLLASTHQVYLNAKPWGFKIVLKDAVKGYKPVAADQAIRYINQDLHPQIAFEFTVRKHRFQRRGDILTRVR